MASEAAELHSLLQTGKLERQSQLQSLTELRMENTALLHRVADLDAKNDEQEKMLASVLARTHSNGLQHVSSEDGIRLPGSEETAMAGELLHDPFTPLLSSFVSTHYYVLLAAGQNSMLITFHLY